MGYIYALQGRDGCGKSETLKIVFQKLKQKLKIQHSQIHDFFPSSVDLKIIISSINGIKIGIESQGDPNSRLAQSLVDFEKAGCNIIFCACRTKGKTVQSILSHNKYFHDFTQQTIVAPGQQAQSNSKMALNLIKKAGL